MQRKNFSDFQKDKERPEQKGKILFHPLRKRRRQFTHKKEHSSIAFLLNYHQIPTF